MTDRQGKDLLCDGDALFFLRDRALLPDECVDLICLDLVTPHPLPAARSRPPAPGPLDQISYH